MAFVMLVSCVWLEPGSSQYVTHPTTSRKTAKLQGTRMAIRTLHGVVSQRISSYHIPSVFSKDEDCIFGGPMTSSPDLHESRMEDFGFDSIPPASSRATNSPTTPVRPRTCQVVPGDGRELQKPKMRRWFFEGLQAGGQQFSMMEMPSNNQN